MSFFHKPLWLKAAKLSICLLAVIGVILGMNAASRWVYSYNGTISLFTGTGLYRYQKWSDGNFERGDVVAARYVRQAWLEDMGWDRKPVEVILKKVAGIPGDRIMRKGEELHLCYGEPEVCRHVATRQKTDSRGVPFPKVDLPEVIPPGFFLLLADHPLSLDSRYMGLFQAHALLGRAEPVWVRAVPEELKTVEGVRASMGRSIELPSEPQVNKIDSQHSPKANDSQILLTQKNLLTHAVDSSRASEASEGVLPHSLIDSNTAEGGVLGTDSTAKLYGENR